MSGFKSFKRKLGQSVSPENVYYQNSDNSDHSRNFLLSPLEKVVLQIDIISLW